MEKNVCKSRSFKLWYFSISHRMALIRSPKDNIYANNIDICFDAVEYIDCPIVLGNIEIEEANLSDLEYVKTKVKSEIESSKVTVLVSEKSRFYIVSNTVKIVENKLDYMELPLCYIKPNFV